MQKWKKMRADTRLMIFLSFFTDASGLPRVQEYVGIISPPIVQIARTASVLTKSLGEKAALLFSVAEMQPVSLQNTKSG
jgi:hypothetical protein